MDSSIKERKRVVIIGGGIAGLSAAYSLRKMAQANDDTELSITLFESQPRLGGKILTEQVDGFTVEGGPDSYIRQKPWAGQLARQLGLDGELIGTNDERRKTYVLNHGRLTPLPDGVMLIVPTRIWPFVTSTLISWQGKIRMGMDFFIPRRKDDADESLGNFIRRRLGTEALYKIAEPLMSGIHVSDPETQSLLGTFPRYRELEKKYGSLIRGMLASRKAASQPKPAGSNNNGHGAAHSTGPTSMFLTFKGGMGQLVDRLVKALANEDIRTGTSVTRLERLPDGRYRITGSDGAQAEADGVILASPAFVSGALVAPFAPELGKLLSGIRYVSTATISVGYRAASFGHPLNGFGVVIPRTEKRQITACTWTSTKFSHRAPEDGVLLRCFVGGPGKEEMVERSDTELIDIVRRELSDLMGVKAEPLFAKVYRWRKGNPQYDVGHLERVSQMHRLCAETAPGMELAGGAYDGVGVPDCIHQGEQAAAKVFQHLQREGEPAIVIQ
jgi:protoporphyrinogen/coproporphyrinogen III oxidase